MAGDERGLARADALAAPLAVMLERVVERLHAPLAEAGDDGIGEVAQEQELLQRHVLHRGDDARAADDVLGQSHGVLPKCGPAGEMLDHSRSKANLKSL